MAELDDLRSYVATKTGKDPDTEACTHKEAGVGIFKASPEQTAVKTPEGAAWMCYYYFNPATDEWQQKEDLRKTPPDTYEYNGEDIAVPDWESEITA